MYQSDPWTGDDQELIKAVGQLPSTYYYMWWTCAKANKKIGQKCIHG